MIWLGESLMYAGEYIADARRLALPLVGGHIHDWNWLLGRWGWIDHAELLGGAVHAVASAVVIGAFAAAARGLWAERLQRVGAMG